MADGETDPERRSGLFPALLRHWRHRRGLSQLDLALAADVSARHVSFLETGRSRPSPEMVLRLAATLGVPLHHVNQMLLGAGHAPAYHEDHVLPPAVERALTLLKTHHEPFPLLVLDRDYTVRDLNGGAVTLLAGLMGGADRVWAAVHDGLNLARLTFDPDGAHRHIVNIDEVGRELLWRIQRELLADPDDSSLREVLDDVLAMPTVEPGWRRVDLSTPAEPTVLVHLRVDGVDLRFITMVTAFQAPQNAFVEQIAVEAWFPADDATAAILRAPAP